VERLAVSTDVLVPRREVFDFLVDFPGYARYSEYLERVERRGDGSEGTTYAVTVAWWRLTHTVTSRVVDAEPPERIDWRLLGPLAAEGAWLIDAVDDPELPETVTADDGAASRVTLVVRYDPTTVDAGHLDLPMVLSLDGLIDRVTPLVEDEAERIVERIVADLEGGARPVVLRVETD